MWSQVIRGTRQCVKSVEMSATEYLGSDRLFLISMLVRLLRVLLLLSVWRLILTGRGEVSGMSLGSVLTYTLVAEMFADFLQCRTWLDGAFWSGTIVTRLVRPMSLFTQFSAEMFGEVIVVFGLFSLPLFLCAPLLGVNPLPASPGAALLFPISLGLAVSVGLAIEYVFAGIGILFEMPTYALTRLRAAISSVLSGAFIPLALLPGKLGGILALLPFASQASAPLRIYTGATDAPRLLLVQLLWAIVLWPIAHATWNRSRERMVSFGG